MVGSWSVFKQQSGAELDAHSCHDMTNLAAARRCMVTLAATVAVAVAVTVTVTVAAATTTIELSHPFIKLADMAAFQG